jgi:hypothetical protein
VGDSKPTQMELILDSETKQNVLTIELARFTSICENSSWTHKKNSNFPRMKQIGTEVALCSASPIVKLKDLGFSMEIYFSGAVRLMQHL